MQTIKNLSDASEKINLISDSSFMLSPTSHNEQPLEDILDRINDMEGIKRAYWEYIKKLAPLSWGCMYWHHPAKCGWLKEDGLIPEAVKDFPECIHENHELARMVCCQMAVGPAAFCELSPENIVKEGMYPPNFAGSLLILFGTENRAPAFVVLGPKTDGEHYRQDEIAFLQRLAKTAFRAYEKIELTYQLIAADKNITITTVAAGIAHEINNNITPIIGRAELLLNFINSLHDQELAQRLESHLKVIFGQGCKIARITKNLTKLSRPMELEIQIISLEDELRSAVEIMSETAGKIKHFKTDDPSSLYTMNHDFSPSPSLIRGDSQQLQQVFINLIINAAHAIEDKGRGALTVGTKAAEGGKLAAFIKDTGVGMSPETLEKMWKPFFTTKKRGKGTGLGMAIVKNVVEAHGGEIKVETKLGEGTTFELIFNALKVSDIDSMEI